MKREILNLSLNSALRKKIPNKSQLTNTLADILLIEKEAIYRRLRGEVAFSFVEIALISKQLGMSLDELVGIQSEKARPFSLQLTDFEYPSKNDYVMWENYLRVLEIFKNHSPFFIFETWNTLPFPLCYKFPHLAKYYIYTWAYQSHNHIPNKRFEELLIEKGLSKLGVQTWDMFTQATETHLIFPENLLENLIKDIQFFRSIRLISEETIPELIKELYACMDLLEEITIKGEYRDTGNKVFIYISGIDIQTDYSLLEAGNNYICMLRALVMTSATTTDEATYLHMKNWFMALKRFSTQISVSGEKERIMFFRKQREAIASLKK